LGEAGVEDSLKSTIEATVAMGAVKKADLQRVIVDTAVQEKVIAHPSYSRLLEVVRAKIVSLAPSAGHQLNAAQALAV
jgi:IS5 family transposase